MNNWDLYNYAHRNNSGGTAVKDTRFKELVEGTITEVVDSEITTIGNRAFNIKLSLVTVDLPNATGSVPEYAFNLCSALTTVNLPNVTGIGSSVFSGCTALFKLDFPNVTQIANGAFNNCSKLEILILRVSKVCSLGSTNAFTKTPIADGIGYIYVPSELVEDYKVATNWATFADQIRAIEDYPDITGG